MMVFQQVFVRKECNQRTRRKSSIQAWFPYVWFQHFVTVWIAMWDHVREDMYTSQFRTWMKVVVWDRSLPGNEKVEPARQLSRAITMQSQTQVTNGSFFGFNVKQDLW